MDSRLSAGTIALVGLATVLSAAAFYLAIGLSPPWWAPWVAAVPVLWVSTRLRWWAAGLVVLLAHGAGGLSLWNYLRELIKFPLWLSLGALLLPALAFSAAVLLFRLIAKRGQPWCALLAFPSVIVAYEYLSSLLLGTFGNTAYTQMDNPFVLQIGSLAGLWGIGLIVMLFAPTLTLIAITHGKTRARLLVTLVVVFGGVYGYGAWRIWGAPAATFFLPVGLAESNVPENIFPQTDADAMRLMRAYAEEARLLARQGAKVVVLPEMTALVRESISGEVDSLFQRTAREADAQIVLGVLHATPKGAFNEARLYLHSSPTPAVYRKHHLVPGLEAGTTPGHDIFVSSQPSGRIGLEICRDMDYAEPANRYGQEKVGLVLVPAWDQGVDAWWHGRMALMRAVEQGFSLVRVAKNGLLTVSDGRGRVLAETTTTPARAFTTLLAIVPVRHEPTLYQRWGDWFAWLDLAGIFVLLLYLSRSGGRFTTEDDCLIRSRSVETLLHTGPPST